MDGPRANAVFNTITIPAFSGLDKLIPVIKFWAI
jgi:hypothetical protein